MIFSDYEHCEEIEKTKRGKYMQGVKSICLNCKYFRLESIEDGICRVHKNSDKKYPIKQKYDHCVKWRDCGQQYYIRLGWLKGQTVKAGKCPSGVEI